MNYMPDVLKILGVSINEPFKIKEWNSKVFFDEDCDLKYLDGTGYVLAENIYDIFIGEVEIEKLPWKPKEGEYYYYVDLMGLNGEPEIGRFTWVFDGYDYLNFNVGNCFRTSEEITDEIKQRILSEMKGAYEND